MNAWVAAVGRDTHCFLLCWVGGCLSTTQHTHTLPHLKYLMLRYTPPCRIRWKPIKSEELWRRCKDASTLSTVVFLLYGCNEIKNVESGSVVFNTVYQGKHHNSPFFAAFSRGTLTFTLNHIMCGAFHQTMERLIEFNICINSLLDEANQFKPPQPWRPSSVVSEMQREYEWLLNSNNILIYLGRKGMWGNKSE